MNGNITQCDTRGQAQYRNVCEALSVTGGYTGDMAVQGRNYFAEWRKFNGLTQERAVERMHTITQGYLSELERGKRRYNEGLLAEMAHAYNCEPWELIGRNPLIEASPPANIFDYFEPGDRSVVEALIKKKSA